MFLLGVARHAGAHLFVMTTPRRSPGGAPDFYIPPDPLPDGPPGALLRAEPVNAYLVPGLRLRANAWRVLYHSTAATGEPTAVSGIVLVPTGGPGPIGRRGRRARVLIGYAAGTHGIGDHAAPSRLLTRGLDWEASMVAQLLARGWAVAVSDYQGLGTPGDHTYMVGRALGPNVLDAMRAARHLLPDELPEQGPAAVIGYSEGGAAAGWAAQLQPTYAPDMPLAGVAVGAAAGDLEAATPGIDGTFFSFFISYGGIGYAAAYPELDFDTYLTPKAREGIGRLRNSSLLQAIVYGPRFTKASDLTSPNVLELPEWRRRLAENRLGRIAPEAPIMLSHAGRDQIISIDQSTTLRDDWQTIGAKVSMYVIRGGVDHLSGAVAGTPVAIDWIARQLRPPVIVAPGHTVRLRGDERLAA
jgi:hypothetical protein